MRKKYHVTLSQAERNQWLGLIRKGRSSALRQTHARILLQADRSRQGLARSDAQIHEALGVAVSTIERVRQRFAEGGLEAALSRRPSQRRYERLLDGAAGPSDRAGLRRTPPRTGALDAAAVSRTDGGAGVLRSPVL